MNIVCSVSGAVMPTQECFDCALSTGRPPCGFDYTLLKALYGSDEQTARASEIHVTDLTGCIKKAFLDKTAPKPESPHEMLVRWLGTTVHGGVEGASAAPTKDAFVDCELPISVEGIVGRADVVYKAGRLVDLKSTRWMYVDKLPYGSHILQVNIYAWMLRKQGREVNRLQIQYIDLSGPTKCRSCSTTVKLIDGQFVCGKCGKVMKNAHLGAYLIDVPMYSDDYIESQIMARKEALQLALQMGIAPQAEPGFLCNYCAHQGVCQPVEAYLPDIIL